MRRFNYLIILLLCGVLSPAAWSHGGLSMDEDSCVLTIGKYFMHFTGYQPTLTVSEEFCEDIPATGETIIVLDILEKDLRSKPIEFRIIRAGINENDTAAVSDNTFYVQPFSTYPGGTISITDLIFPEAGDFVGLLTVTLDEGAVVSRFPFSVGKGGGIPGYAWLIVVLLIGAGFYYTKVIKQS